MIARNLFFDLTDDEPALAIAPVRTIPITDAIRDEDASKQEARANVRITWTPRLSDRTPKTSAIPRCKRGHAFTPDNTVIEGGQRKCHECKKARARAWYQKSDRCKGVGQTREDRLEQKRKCESKRRQRRKDQRLCVRCGKPNAGQMIRCDACRAVELGIAKQLRIEKKARA